MDAQSLSPAQVAARLQVSEHTIYTWLRSGRLRGRKVGRRWRVSQQAVEAFLGRDGQEEFDAPLTPEEQAESEAAWQGYLRGEDPGEPLEAVREAVLVTRRA